VHGHVRLDGAHPVVAAAVELIGVQAGEQPNGVAGQGLVDLVVVRHPRERSARIGRARGVERDGSADRAQPEAQRGAAPEQRHRVTGELGALATTQRAVDRSARERRLHRGVGDGPGLAHRGVERASVHLAHVQMREPETEERDRDRGDECVPREQSQRAR
jgi:hypothetical protein